MIQADVFIMIVFVCLSDFEFREVTFWRPAFQLLIIKNWPQSYLKQTLFIIIEGSKMSTL